MKKRIWVSSGIREEVDVRQQRLMDKVLEQIEKYYRTLYLTQTKYAQPLSLSMLSKMCNRSNIVVMGAVRMLANSIEEGAQNPAIFYVRRKSGKNASHRPYQIFLKR